MLIKTTAAYHLLSVLGILSFSTPLASAESSIEKDRAAILSMAGKFKVTFKFYETHSLKDSYAKKEKIYQEEAHEMVKIVEDTPKRIVLQHILLADDGLEIMVVKHWGQIWTYEDAEILEYQRATTWKKHSITPQETKGTWTQTVTQTDDSPRYESYGKWNHQGANSMWISEETPRPLPRREYSKRKDYDVLMGINTHAITPNGWVHEQQNRKLVKRDGKLHYLAAERGYNTYERVKDFDFAEAEKYWEITSLFWQHMRAFWAGAAKDASGHFSYQRKVDGVSVRKAMRKIAPSEESRETPSAEAVRQAFLPYLIKE